MRTLVLLTTTLLNANGLTEDARRTALMNAAEKQLKMPEGAKTIAHYSRFYAKLKSGEVRGVFVEATYDGLPVGQRRWLTNVKLLPVAFDGGCYVVTVIFDPRAARVTRAYCNGVA